MGKVHNEVRGKETSSRWSHKCFIEKLALESKPQDTLSFPDTPLYQSLCTHTRTLEKKVECISNCRLFSRAGGPWENQQLIIICCHKFLKVSFKGQISWSQSDRTTNLIPYFRFLQILNYLEYVIKTLLFHNFHLPPFAPDHPETAWTYVRISVFDVLC